MDGGVRSGLDVLKALACGAKACLIGRAWAWALGAGARRASPMCCRSCARSFAWRWP